MALGIQSKIEPSLDKSSSNRMVRDLEKQISQVENLQFESDGFQGRTTPGGRGGGGGGMGGAAAGASAGSRLGGMSLGGMAKGAGVLGAVSLGGVLANRMLGAMQKASGHLQATSSILGTTLDLLVKPFGDFLGKTLRPMSKALLEMATGLNQNISSNGLVVGGIQSILDMWNNFPGELGKVIIQSLGEIGEGLFGENKFFTAMQDFQWSDWIPIFKWTDFVDLLDWGKWLNPMVWGEWIKNLEWSSWIDGFEWPDVGTPEWPKITVPDSLKKILNVEETGGGGNNGDDGTGGNTSGNTTSRPDAAIPWTPGANGSGNGGWFNPDTNPFQPGNQDLNFSFEVDGRRLYDTAVREGNDLLDRI